MGLAPALLSRDRGFFIAGCRGIAPSVEEGDQRPPLYAVAAGEGGECLGGDLRPLPAEEADSLGDPFFGPFTVIGTIVWLIGQWGSFHISNRRTRFRAASSVA